MTDTLIPMALSKKESKALTQPMASDGPRYPWGLSINLDTASLAKLKMTELPKVGSYVTVTAYCCVSSVSESEQVDGDANRSVSLQIEDMSVAANAKKRGTVKKYVAAETKKPTKSAPHTVKKKAY